MSEQERGAKRSRLLALLDAEDLDAVVLRTPGACAWWSGGGRFHVVATPEAGVGAFVVTRDGDELVTSVNEAPRLLAEEAPGYDDRVRVLPWSQPLESALPSGPRVGADLPLPGTRDVSEQLRAARRALVPAEQDRYRALGADAAAALTDACAAASPDDPEYALAARAAAGLLERGADPVVLLVAGEERLPFHRHPLPTDAPVGAAAMVVVCARRAGLVASLTRFVSFGPFAAADRLRAVAAVDAAFLRATTPGRPVGEVFREGVAAYAAQGFEPGEETRHHQGGPTGYAPRDPVADAATSAPVEAGQAFAWNPSGPGVKSEDTVLARDGAPPEVLTVDPRWPVVEVDGLARPWVLER